MILARIFVWWRLGGLAEARRRLRNFFVGPRLRVVAYREPWDFRWGVLPRWVSSEGWHFTWVGLTLYWFSRRVDIRWQDNN